MCLVPQSPVFPPISQHRFLLFTQPHFFVPTLFIRLVALLGATYQSVVGRLQWSHSSRSESLKFETSPYFLICTRPGRIIEDSTSHGICLKPRMLSGSSFPTINSISLTPSVSTMSITVALDVPLSPINEVSFKSDLLCFVIHSLSQTPLKLALWKS